MSKENRRRVYDKLVEEKRFDYISEPLIKEFGDPKTPEAQEERKEKEKEEEENKKKETEKKKAQEKEEIQRKITIAKEETAKAVAEGKKING